jgi:hypothetical protein
VKEPLRRLGLEQEVIVYEAHRCFFNRRSGGQEKCLLWKKRILLLS